VTRTWVLNPGAEREILAGKSAPNQRTVAQMRERASLFDDLRAGEPRVWLAELEPTRKHSGRALVWCPTPAALAACRAVGLAPQPAPGFDVLRRVLSKSFLAEALPERTAPHHRVIRTLDDYRARAATGALRAKRLDGFAGKGQRTLYADPLPGDELWVQHQIQAGGLVVEAELDVQGEFSVHGVVCGEDTLIGEPCRVHTDDARAPLAVPTACSDTPFAREIRERGDEAARALASAGYRGAFGLDFIQAGGTLYATDINARFTLGFSTGLGPLREQALELILS
jgi:hypothetical protein